MSDMVVRPVLIRMVVSEPGASIELASVVPEASRPPTMPVRTVFL
jgi:hypothetical protein